MGEYYEYNKLPVILYPSIHNSQGIGKTSQKIDHFYKVTSKTKLQSLRFTQHVVVFSATISSAAHFPPSCRCLVEFVTAL
jgi:hypothetical protein